MVTIVHAVQAAILLAAPLAAQARWSELERDRAPLDRVEPRAARALSAADCTGDGLPDLLAANSPRGPFPGTNRFLRNVGDARFVDASGNLPTNDDFSSTTLLGDVDGDGDRDGITLGGTTVALRNDGLGVFTDATSAALPASYPMLRHDTGVLGDFDGDGDLDLVSLNLHTDSYLQNNGAGVFTPGPLLPFLRTTQGVRIDVIAPWDALATDLDGNGTLDVVIACVGRMLWFSGNGNGTFVDASAQLGTTFPATARSVAAGDIDGDGDLDLVFALWGNPSLQRTGVVVLQNNGAAPFTDVTNTALPNQGNAQCVALTDLDLDGALDLVVGRPGATLVARNQGNGTFAPAPAAMQPPGSLDVVAITVVDFTNDGWPDLATVPLLHQNWGRVELFHNAHGAALVPLTTTRLPQQATGATQLECLDLDLDGDEDLLQANFGTTCFLANDGDGAFTDGSATFVTAAGSPMRGDCFAAGDIDGDGLVDVVFAGNQQNLFVFRNHGAGVMVDETLNRLLAPQAARFRLVLADIDGDTDLDLVTAVMPATGPLGGDEVFVNTGAGVFTRFTHTRIPFTFAPKFGLVASDLDGDLDVDLAFVGTSGLRYLENDGSGTFTDVTAARAPAATFHGVAIAALDLEPDGDTDLLIGHTNGTLVYVNQGNGVLADESALRLPPDSGRTSGFASLELLHSGYQGLVLAKDASGPAGGLVVWLNLGSSFVDVSSMLDHDPDATRALAVADLDQDGDFDLVASKQHGGSNSPTKVLLGLETQLHTPHAPRLGGQLDFAIFARGLLTPTAATVVISFAPQQPRLFAPPLGTIGIDVAAALFLPPVAFAPTGETTASVTIPNAAGLHGIRLWSQALVLHGSSPLDARLTNGRAETLTF